MSFGVSPVVAERSELDSCEIVESLAAACQAPTTILGYKRLLRLMFNDFSKKAAVEMTV
jgi:hypothetical protein